MEKGEYELLDNSSVLTELRLKLFCQCLALKRPTCSYPVTIKKFAREAGV